jgi:hypothetical protein
MQFATTLPDESLEALAARVYDLGEKPPPTAVRAAAKALADANPFLRKLADVPPGTVVEVPRLEQGGRRPGTTQGEDAIASGLVLDHVEAAAALVARQLAADLDAETADADATLQLARSDELKRLDAPGLADAMARTVAAAEARAASAKELRSRQEAMLGQLARDLDELAAAHGMREGDTGK